jgi:hypothetical protein
MSYIVTKGHVRGEGVYVPLWTRNTVTSSVNTGFFERQPATKPVTTCVRPGTKDYDHGTTDDGAALNELHGFKFHSYNGVVMAEGVPEVWNANGGGRNEMILPAIARQLPDLQISKELHFGAKILFLNLAQVGAIKCNCYRIRPVEGGELSKGKKSSNCGMVRNGAGYFGLVRGGAPRALREGCKA